MNKNLLFVIIFFYSVEKVFSQGAFTAYLQIKGEVNMFDEVQLVSPSAKKRFVTKADSLIDYNTIKAIFSKTNDPESILNMLAVEGWTLLSVTWVTRNSDDRHRYPFLLYYFKKEIVIPKK
ncbi:MAG: hypothetical protein RIR12_1460 [Bacteroidota bacterium]|jgi:hypothetical protein